MPNQRHNEPQRRIPQEQRPVGAPQRGVQSGAGGPQQQNNGTQQPQRTPTQQRKEKEGGRWVRAIVMVLATLCACLFLALYILDTANDLFGLNQPDKQIEVEIPQGSTNSDVARILEENDVIKNVWVFRVYADIKTKDRQFQPGTYLFNSNYGYDEIIRDLRVGNNLKEEVRLFFPEGWTLREIANHLEAERVCSADEFLEYLQSTDFDYEFFNGIPDDANRYLKLEGYVFPDTYDFYVGENVSEVARKFLNNFNRKMDDDLQKRMQEINMTIDETIILASIIQREAADVDDMHLVSSVFHNRMALSETYPKLQSDVTIFYVNNNIKPYLQTANQTMYDAYNTYERNGLPVGAICNPGMDAIRAALYPVESDYYFFVTDSDGNFYYANTASDHYTNVRKAMSTGGEAHGIDTQ